MTQLLKTIDIAIYGKLANYFDGKHIAVFKIEVDPDAHLGELLQRLKIPPVETSFIFLDAVLCDVPGLMVNHNEALKDGSHVGVFSTGYMWPYQYRDGVPMSEPLKSAMSVHGAMHHTYTNLEAE